MSVKIERLKEAIASLFNEREARTAKNAPLRSLCQSMCQECIHQGVEPSVFYLQWGKTELGKEMMARSAEIIELQRLIDQLQNELLALEEKIGGTAVVES
jgi:hypothetical protein